MKSNPAALRVALLAAALTGASHTATAAPDTEVELLREQIRQLDQKLRVLERKQEIKDEEQTAKAKAQPVLSAGVGGVAFASPDKNFELKLKLLAQIDGRFFYGDDVPSNSGFLVRRVRTIFQGTLYKNFDFSIVPEYAGGNATSSSPSLVDAWVAGRVNPAFQVKVGKFATPVIVDPGANRHFNEAPFVNTLAPNRDIGVEASGLLAQGVFGYRLGVVNGARNNTTALNSQPSDAGTIAGRLSVQPFATDDGFWKTLSVGVGFSGGREEGALTNIVTNSQQPLLNFGTLVGDGFHGRVSPGVVLYSGPLSFAAEYIWEQQDYRRSSTNIFQANNTAWRLSGGYVLTGEDSGPNGVVPTQNSDLSNGAWGAFELVGRVSGIDLEDSLFDPKKGGLSPVNNATGALATGIGVNWYLNRLFRIQLNGEYTAFEGGGGGAVKHDEKAVIVRAQLNY